MPAPPLLLLVAGTLISILLISAAKLLVSLFLVPRRLQIHFERQGVSGPPRCPISGNAAEIRDLIARAQSAPIPGPGVQHGIVRRVVPHYAEWSARYGKTFVFWFGAQPRLAVADPDLARAALSPELGGGAAGGVDKPDFNPVVRQLFAEGLAGLKGRRWAQHRRIINPAFSMERVKGWVPTIAECMLNMLEKWGADMGHSGDEIEIEVHKEFHSYAADVIARVAFGSDYGEGKQIFQMQEELAHLTSIAIRSLYIPGFRFIPTEKNRRRWKLNGSIRSLLRKQIERKAVEYESSKNLLGLMLSANRKEGEEKLTIDEIIDECTSFYFAGKETTANILTWAILLLATHQDWQSKARDEAACFCGDERLPSADDLSNLKIVTMVLKESLRLYPPVVFMNRMATRDIKLGKLHIPKDTHLYIPTVAIHHAADVWGENADEFDPSRFSETSPHPPAGAYFPFGQGPATCVGQNLALVEAKVALAMILRHFSFRVSPSYAHSPIHLMTLQPQYGVQVMFEKI